MKVQELMKILSEANPNDEVRMRVELPNSTVGASPAVTVKSASIGFDWDNGSVLLYTDRHVIALSDTQYQYFKDEKKNADKTRMKAYRDGITDVAQMEKDLNPLFKTGE